MLKVSYFLLFVIPFLNIIFTTLDHWSKEVNEKLKPAAHELQMALPQVIPTPVLSLTNDDTDTEKLSEIQQRVNGLRSDSLGNLRTFLHDIRVTRRLIDELKVGTAAKNLKETLQNWLDVHVPLALFYPLPEFKMPERLRWLFVATLCISVANVIFETRCPSAIKLARRPDRQGPATGLGDHLDWQVAVASIYQELLDRYDRKSVGPTAPSVPGLVVEKYLIEELEKYRGNQFSEVSDKIGELWIVLDACSPRLRFTCGVFYGAGLAFSLYFLIRYSWCLFSIL